ncbi:MAG TPA: alpha-ketoacid dehydrogenase subunit beta [Solirubrobacteraceae bacterium]|jgi:pyruvate dehydrogenase E1 component beta subunit
MTVATTTTMTFSQAIREALAEELERDETVFLMGQDIGAFGGVFGVTAGLHERFGDRRIVDTPISETLMVGGGVGAAITGLRPVVELQFADFIGVAMDEIALKAAKWRYMHGGLFEVPLVLRLPEGAVGGAGPEQSQCPEAMLWNVPGIYVVVPSSPADAKGLLKSAIRSNNPVAFFEHKALYNTRGPVPEGEHLVPLGEAAVCREGSDVTVVAWARMVGYALTAAEQLESEGIQVEVIDPRGLRPLDLDTILASVAKTGRIVFAHEAPLTGGPASEVAALVGEHALADLVAPIVRVAAPDVPLPQSSYLEKLYLPSVDDVIAAVRRTLES